MLMALLVAGGFYTGGKAYDSERSNALPLVRVSWNRWLLWR